MGELKVFKWIELVFFKDDKMDWQEEQLWFQVPLFQED